MTEYFFTSKGHRCSPFLASVKAQVLCPRSAFMIDEPFTSINRRRRLHSGLGQTSRWKSLCWAWSIFWTYGLYSGPLRVLGCKLYLLCVKAYMACPLVLHQISPTPSTFPGCLRHLPCHPLATSCFFSHRITGYSSGFLLPAPILLRQAQFASKLESLLLIRLPPKFGEVCSPDTSPTSFCLQLRLIQVASNLEPLLLVRLSLQRHNVW
ncbi:unnamed protein product [Arabidopsis arenosa]|uniref:Uncharacterized protein n=1 Tax=Arabidopsis arenosa TaxID=38785 RepID=A0A8S2AYT9_ARAAE|nr:unnamed protein product [Arabidopsis arenosa]